MRHENRPTGSRSARTALAVFVVLAAAVAGCTDARTVTPSSPTTVASSQALAVRPTPNEDLPLPVVVADTTSCESVTLSWENLPTPSGSTAETWQVQVSGTNATNFDDPLSYDNANYDSTSLTLSLAPGAYLVRVRAKSGEPHVNNSHFSEIVVFTVEECSRCTYTQGYWKNHTDVWPVSALTIGSVVYTAAQLEDIFNEPVKGNGLISLAHQLIAAKLNIENGANGSVVAAAIADADAMIGALVIPSVGGGFLAPSDTSGLGTILDSYNNGIIGPGHCD